MKVIKFFRESECYGFLSNFSPHQFRLDNKSWPTVEHYFQAKKFHGTVHEDRIRLLESPMEAAIAGRDRTKPLRIDWEIVKARVMKEGVYAKFFQNCGIRQKLIATGDTFLIENTKTDSYWGNGFHGRGLNMLGQILMQVRAKLSTIR